MSKMSPIIVAESRKEADLIASKMSINKLEFLFIPMASCHIQVKNHGYVLKGRKFIFPKALSKATRGRVLVQQAEKLRRLLEESGGRVVDCDYTSNPSGRRPSQKAKVGEK